MRWRRVAQPELGEAGGVMRSGEGGPEGRGKRGGSGASGAGPRGLRQDRNLLVSPEFCMQEFVFLA